MADLRETLFDVASVTDGLAAERTFLAAERTLLAYLRTAFGMFLVGVTGARLLEDSLLVGVGYTLAVSSLLVVAFGLRRFRRSKRATARILGRLTTRT